ncbi:ABC transporter permease subunit [Metamycoplasma equirhinis]|uniref:ABC transporter permease subunit n=1 Tax=Metamycoplasma equirhinis TaxID=92402 RepID=UPI0035932956
MKNNNSITIFRKIIAFFFIFLSAITIVFFAINLLMEPQIKKNIAVANQIEPNLWKRYLEFIKNLFIFNPGKIFSSELNNTNLSIFSLYFAQFKWTILFISFIFLLGLIIGNILGIWSGYKFNKTPDFIINLIVASISTIPLLIVAILAMTNSHIFGYPSQFISNAKYTFLSLLVPTIVTSFGTISLFHSRARKIIKETLTSNYYQFAISLGLNKFRLFRKQIFKNLLISELQVIIPFFTLLFSSSLVVERIFSIPGHSVFISYAFTKAEINLIMFYFVFNFILILIFRLINHIILTYLNPLQKIESKIKMQKKIFTLKGNLKYAK